jgi:hypothetical protein
MPETSNRAVFLSSHPASLQATLQTAHVQASCNAFDGSKWVQLLNIMPWKVDHVMASSSYPLVVKL